MRSLETFFLYVGVLGKSCAVNFYLVLNLSALGFITVTFPVHLSFDLRVLFQAKYVKNIGIGNMLKIIGRRCCFHIDGIQKYAIVFKLKMFNLRMFSRTLDIKCSFVCSNFVLFRIIRIVSFYCAFCFFTFIQFVLLYNKKNKETFCSLQK